MKLETCRTVARGKLEMTEPTPLGLSGRVVANLWIFPLLGRRRGNWVPATGLVPRVVLGWAEGCYLWDCVFFLALAGGVGESGKGTGLRGELELG